MPQIFIRSLETLIPITIEEDATINDLKEEIENLEFIPIELQRLVYGTTILSIGKVFSILQEDDTVTLNLNINGGMRAKWRKKRMRRLRRKRRKMRQRAR